MLTWCWLMTHCGEAVFDNQAYSAHMIASVHVYLPLSDSLTHPDTHLPFQPFVKWSLPHMYTHTHRPWLATSSPQVTDVCMWGDDSNEYWITGMMYLSFFLILPPTLTLQPFTRVSKSTPSFSSRWQPLVLLAHQCHQTERISQLLASHCC